MYSNLVFPHSVLTDSIDLVTVLDVSLDSYGEHFKSSAFKENYKTLENLVISAEFIT